MALLFYIPLDYPEKGVTTIEVITANSHSSQTNGWLARAASHAPQPIKGIMEFFINALPGRGDPTTTNDDALIIKTSPTIWEYEMFRLEWDRRTLLREIEMMLKSDPRIKRANKVFAATAVRRGLAVKVTSNVNETVANRAQEIIDQLIRDTQLNSKLPSWARILPKEGDLFLNPVLDIPTRRIVNIKRLPAITMQRNDDMTGNFPDRQKAFQQIDPISLQVLQEFPLWSVNHIRWNHEEGERYGESQYLQCRGYWKKLDMTEQDLVVRRRTRAPLRRLHSVGDKDHPQSWDQIEKYKAINKLDPKKAQLTTDYYGNGLVSITSLEGDTGIDKITDIVHLQEVYMMGTGVPLHILGFGQNVNRDIVAQQMEQFQEDMQELRNLLEWGDSSPYSGLRLIFDFALALQGVDPTMVDYNVRWWENDNESANDRVTRATQLRGSANMHPDPLITKKTALMLVAKDIGLENEAAVEAELQALAEEAPIVSAPAASTDPNDPGSEDDPNKDPDDPSENPPAAEKKITDSLDPKQVPNLHSPGYNQLSGFFPLHGDAAAKMEMAIAKSTRKNFALTFKSIKPELEAYINKVKTLGPVYGDAVEYKPAHDSFDHILQLYEAAWAANEDSLVNDYFNHYVAIASLARANAAKTMGIQVTTDFTNPDITHYLQKQAAERVKGIGETTKDLLRKQLAQAYENKETVAQWTARIANVVNCDFPAGRADMIARTELASAYSKGLLATYQEGGVSQVQWMAVMDDHTCEECAGLDGEVMSLADAEDNLPKHPRCLPGDTRVSAEGIAATSERWYDGNLVIINTTSGKKLSCTPNHPILTLSGWVAAGLLNVGDDVISSGASDWNAAEICDGKDMPPMIHDVAEAFRSSGQVTASPVPLSPEDFHGDGKGSKVAVIWSDGLLMDGSDSPVGEHGSQFSLNTRDVKLLGLDGLSAPASFVDGLNVESGALVGSLSEPLPLIRGSVGHSLEHGSASVASVKASICQPSDDDRTADKVCSSQTLDRFTSKESLDDFTVGNIKPFAGNFSGFSADDSVPGLLDGSNYDIPMDSQLASKIIGGAAGNVFTDNVVCVEVKPFSGHVYNLQTKDGFYVANGIITHNCRCTVVSADGNSIGEGE